MKYAVVDLTGLVVNTIEWDGITPWAPPEEHIAVPLLEGGTGWMFANGQFIPPPEPSPEEVI
jgi:hypothetical protein